MTQSNGHIFEGKVFVVGDNVDTDQIIPARHLSLVPTIPEEYARLGAQALSGLPTGPRYVAEGREKTEYRIIVAGRNFGCGSSREHAPIALGAAGCRVVVAESFARIFFRNCIATGEVYPIERREPIHELRTGEMGEVRLDENLMILSNGRQIRLAPLGDVLPVIDAGGIFAYSRQSGLLG